jgi:hypothetical protein
MFTLSIQQGGVAFPDTTFGVGGPSCWERERIRSTIQSVVYILGIIISNSANNGLDDVGAVGGFDNAIAIKVISIQNQRRRGDLHPRCGSDFGEERLIEEALQQKLVVVLLVVAITRLFVLRMIPPYRA